MPGGRACFAASAPYCSSFYETDYETGLEYAGARFLDPSTAMFLSHDPAEQFASPYAYGSWDPMNAVDPTGALLEGLVAIALTAYSVYQLGMSVYNAARYGSGTDVLAVLGIALVSFNVGMALNAVVGSVFEYVGSLTNDLFNEVATTGTSESLIQEDVYPGDGLLEVKSDALGEALGGAKPDLSELYARGATSLIVAQEVVTRVSAGEASPPPQQYASYSNSKEGLREACCVTGPLPFKGMGQLHHIATNKSIVSGFTEAFKRIFSKAGMSLNNAANLVRIPGHVTCWHSSDQRFLENGPRLLC